MGDRHRAMMWFAKFLFALVFLAVVPARSAPPQLALKPAVTHSPAERFGGPQLRALASVFTDQDMARRGSQIRALLRDYGVPLAAD